MGLFGGPSKQEPINPTPFDGDAFLRGAEDCLSQTPWGVTVAMAGDQTAGVLQLDGERYQRQA